MGHWNGDYVQNELHWQSSSHLRYWLLLIQKFKYGIIWVYNKLLHSLLKTSATMIQLKLWQVF